MTSWLNISGTLSAFRLLRDPSLCLPHHTVPTFAHLPVPLSPALAPSSGDAGSSDEKKRAAPDIRAVVLDKDNCFAVPHGDDIYPAYKVGVDMVAVGGRN
jgi:phosphatidylglycerophosphatase GEP4